ncbi:MAG: MBL fold metallo-hydrolase [Pseudomonadota bacterium]|nr:MBL fold metallo-hydrolase [Pseudomonadota bacterium]
MSMSPAEWASLRAEFKPGEPRQLFPLVRRITAGNAGPMTGPGTNCYLIGKREVAIIDPGPDNAQHIQSIINGSPGPIRWILVTHTHPDHAPGCHRLSELTGAPVYAHPAIPKGPARVPGFRADQPLNDGDTIETDEFTLRALHTPGHASNHLCFLLDQEALLIAGDQVMDGSTVVIAPPDGDMRAYLASLERLMGENIQHIAPGHGRILDDAQSVLQRIIDHRLVRQDKILIALAETPGEMTIPEIVTRAYTDVPRFLHPVAELSVHAHLLKLMDEKRVAATSNATATRESRWQLIAPR